MSGMSSGGGGGPGPPSGPGPPTPSLGARLSKLKTTAKDIVVEAALVTTGIGPDLNEDHRLRQRLVRRQHSLENISTRRLSDVAASAGLREDISRFSRALEDVSDHNGELHRRNIIGRIGRTTQDASRLSGVHAELGRMELRYSVLTGQAQAEQWQHTADQRLENMQREIEVILETIRSQQHTAEELAELRHRYNILSAVLFA